MNMKYREYAETFHTPLHDVVKLDPEFVLRHIYENKYSHSEVNGELEDFLEKLYQFKDPSYQRITNEETEALVDAVLNKELKRAGLQKETIGNKPVPQKEAKEPAKPKSGGMKFDDLEAQESKAEGPKAGFED